MVSKIAVMALVAVVAAPILLGYGMNIQTESYTDYESGSYTDVTDYVYNIKADETKLRYTPADIYQFNSRSFHLNDSRIYPRFEEISTTNTAIQMDQLYFKSSSTVTLGKGYLPCFHSQVIDGGYDANNYYTFIVTYTDDTTYEFDHVKVFYIEFDADGVGTGEVTAFLPSYGWAALDNVKSVQRVPHGNTPYLLAQWTNTGTTYANLSKGYHLNADYPISTSASSPASSTLIQADGIVKSMVLTFNLDSITDPTYYMDLHMQNHVNVLELKKTTTDGVATWTYQTREDSEAHELYYNPLMNNNTYQLYLNGKVGGEFRYVGAWTDSIGVAQPYITYPFSYTLPVDPFEPVPDALPPLLVKGQTPTMRIDAAMIATYGYKVIRDVTFTPASFLNNPSTKITNLVEVGPSLTFGGNTYAVSSDGNMTIGTRSFSLNNMILDSVPVAGGYDNRINGIVVSTTAQPSQIVFNGDWQVSVSIATMSSISKESTHWVAGKFAWNGIDTDFKIAGLMASLGAFIALAVYGRRSGAKVLPLLVVCGGAALMFLVMI